MHRGPHPWYTIPSSKFLSAVMFQTKREYSFLFVCALLVVSSGFHFAHAANDANVKADAHAANDENVEVDVSDHYKLIDVALKTSKVIMKKFGKMESEDELRRQSAEFHVKTQKALTETVAELENEYPDLRADLRHTIRKRLKILYSKISLFEKEKYRILEEREMDYKPEKMEEEPPKSDVEDLTSSSYTEPDLFGDSIKDNQRETWWKSFYSGIDLANVMSKILGPSLLGCVIAGGTMIAVIFNIVYQGAVGDWFRENASCSALIGKFSVCGSLITFLFGAAKLTADPMRAVHKGVKAAISTISGMPMCYKILIGVGLVLICVLSIVCYFFRWRILRCICGYERRISLNRFAHRPRRRHRNFGSDYSVSSYTSR
eukprot:918177_1